MHSFHPSFLREYDARGIIDETLSIDDANALGKAFGTLIIRNGGTSVSVGRDGRESSPSLEAALVDGLSSTGLKVLKVGLGPTPMVYYSVFELNTDGCVMVTGSHNPPNYNGFKMMLGQSAIYGDDIYQMGDMATTGDIETGDGSVEDVELFDRYVARLLKDFDGNPVNVAWDPGNGAAGEVTKAVVDQLIGHHVLINDEIDGTFPNHHPDPTIEANLEQLREVVSREGLDLGIAFDGDGDRIGAIDAQGRVVWGDQLLAIMAEDVLSEVPGAHIIADVKASQALFDHISKCGGKPVMWKTGHSLVKARMKELDSPLAGEMSGHIFYKHKFYGFDDALYAALRLLNAIAKSGKTLAELKDSLPSLVNTPEMRFDCEENRKFGIVAEVIGRLEAEGADFNDIDGARVLTDDGWWLLRASNTQAVLVGRCEAKNEAGLERLKSSLKNQLSLSGLTVTL